MSEQLLELKENGVLQGLREKWFSNTADHKTRCVASNNKNGDHILIAKPAF